MGLTRRERRKREVHDRILEAAVDLFEQQGFDATKVDEICELAGVSKGSFYHAFDSKEDLGLAVLEAFGERNARLIAGGPQAHVADPVDRALQLLDHLMATAGEMWGSGCLLGNFALDLAETHPAIRQAVSDAFRGVAAGLAAGMAPLAAEGGPLSSITLPSGSRTYIDGPVPFAP